MKSMMTLMLAFAICLSAHAGQLTVTGQRGPDVNDKVVATWTLTVASEVIQLSRIERSAQNGKRQMCEQYLDSYERTESGSALVKIAEACSQES